MNGAPAAGDGWRCLVLGGSGALGGTVCRALAAAGAQLAFTWHRGEARAAELRRAIPRARAYRLDLADVPAIKAVVDEAAAALGGLDALVHAAALGEAAGAVREPGAHQKSAEVSEADWDQLFAVNARSAFFAVRYAADWLARRGGNVVLVGSVDGVKPVPAPAVYAASKAAVSGLARALGKELGPRGVRINVVAPGVLESGLSRALPEALRRQYLRHCALGRLGRLEEAAALVAWLARENTYVTGQTIVVDGAL